MNARTQRLCIWCGPLLVLIFGVGFWPIAGFVPPPRPSASTQEIARFYTDNQTRIRIGVIICSLSSALALPYSAVISLWLRRIEGRWSPLALTQALSGVLLTAALLYPMMLFGACSFRPEERSPEITQTINDIGWILFVGIVSPLMLQSLVIGLTILRDTAAEPTFPRWIGYLNIWACILFIPGPLLLVFKHGPLAWDGLFTFYLPFVVFAAWIAAMVWAVEHGLKEQDSTPERTAAAHLTEPTST